MLTITYDHAKVCFFLCTRRNVQIVSVTAEVITHNRYLFIRNFFLRFCYFWSPLSLLSLGIALSAYLNWKRQTDLRVAAACIRRI